MEYKHSHMLLVGLAAVSNTATCVANPPCLPDAYTGKSPICVEVGVVKKTFAAILGWGCCQRHALLCVTKGHRVILELAFTINERHFHQLLLAEWTSATDTHTHTQKVCVCGFQSLAWRLTGSSCHCKTRSRMFMLVHNAMAKMHEGDC